MAVGKKKMEKSAEFAEKSPWRNLEKKAGCRTSCYLRQKFNIIQMNNRQAMEILGIPSAEQKELRDEIESAI